MGRLLHGVVLIGVILAGMNGCATKSVSETSQTRIAVFDIEAYSMASAGSSTDMTEILTLRLIQSLQENPSVTVVEREQITLALEELNLGSSALAEEETRLKIGQVIGASHMIFGGYQVFGGMMRLDLRMVEVETGKIVSVVDRSGPGSNISEWLTTVDEMGTALLK